jgi:hypothetical protein
MRWEGADPQKTETSGSANGRNIRQPDNKKMNATTQGDRTGHSQMSRGIKRTTTSNHSLFAFLPTIYALYPVPSSTISSVFKTVICGDPRRNRQDAASHSALHESWPIQHVPRPLG